jgi:hypothetical protein
VNFGVIAGLGREPAIGARYDVFAADDFSEAHQPFGDQFRMFDDIAGMEDHARHDRLAVRQLVFLEYVIIVLVAGVRSLEGIDAGIDAIDVVDDLAKLHFENAWPFVDSVTGVKADPILGNIPEGVIDTFDEDVRLAAALGIVQIVVREDVRQERVVHLHIETGIDYCLILGAHGVAEREEERLVVLVIVVEANTAQGG